MAPLALVKNSMAPLACGGMWLLLHRHTIALDRHTIEVGLRQLLQRQEANYCTGTLGNYNTGTLGNYCIGTGVNFAQERGLLRHRHQAIYWYLVCRIFLSTALYLCLMRATNETGT